CARRGYGTEFAYW
nr:immunoglobulin heavy chain junction region [Mus musculus]